jgi:hypothetical protein
VALATSAHSAQSPASGVGLGYILNKGQWDAQAKFLLPGEGLNVWLTANGPVMDVHRFVPDARSTSKAPNGHEEGDVIATTFLGARASAVSPAVQLAGNLNYFVGQKSSNWVTDVPHFAEATSGDLYPGIRARYYVDSGSPRYDLVIAPGADPSQIAMQVDGAQGVQVLPNGNLQIQTSLGPIEERGLVAYQSNGANNSQVACKMSAEGNTVRFKLGSYDKSRKLVIDPLVFSTFLNVSGHETITDGAGGVDSSGEVTMSGIGLGNNVAFPTTTGAYQKTPGSQATGCYIAKLSADGTHLIYGTFLSGTKGVEGPNTTVGVAFDQAGNVVVAGSTSQTDFPVTASAFRKVYIGGTSGCGFVTRLSPNGNALVSSTYYDAVFGGFGLDHEGNAVLYGRAYFGMTIRLSDNAFQRIISGNDGLPGFVAKLDPQGGFIACTFVSGTGISNTATLEVKVALHPISFDADDNIVVASTTEPGPVTYVPTTPNALYTTLPGPHNNSFLVKLSPDLSSLLVGTLFPFTIGAIEVQSDGSYLIAGWSYSTLPTTPGTVSTGLSGGGICLARMSADGSQLLRTAELQGSDGFGDNHMAKAVVTGADGNILVGGLAVPGFPTTTGAYQTASAGGEGAIFFEMSPDFSKLLYATYLSGTSYSYVHGVFPLGLGSAAIEGAVIAGTFPTTPGAYDNSSASVTSSNFVAKFTLPVATGLHLSANPITGSYSVIGTVSLPAPAPPGGVVVQLSSTNPSTTVPASVTVPANLSSSNFTVTTSAVTKVVTGTITATVSGGTGSIGISVVPAVLTSVTSAASNISAGTSTPITVKLTGPAAGSGDLIALASSSPVVSVPASVPIYNGSTLAVVSATSAAVTASTSVTITASFAGVKKTITLTVDPALSNFSVSPTAIVGGNSALGTATIAGRAGTAGVTLSLTSSNPILTVPSTVVIPANGNYKTFAMTSQGVNVATVVTVTGKEGSLAKTFTVTVNPAALASLTPSLATVIGGQSVNVVLKLNGNAGSNGLAVTLSSSSPSLVSPSGVGIAPNTNSKVFTVTTKAVTAVTHVTITAKANGVTQTTVVTLNPKS